MELLLKRAGFRADRLSIWAMQVPVFHSNLAIKQGCA